MGTALDQPVLTCQINQVETGELDSGKTILTSLAAGLHNAGKNGMGSAGLLVHVSFPYAPILGAFPHHVQGIFNCSTPW